MNYHMSNVRGVTNELSHVECFRFGISRFIAESEYNIPEHLVFVVFCLSVSCVLVVVSYSGWSIIDCSFRVSVTFIY